MAALHRHHHFYKSPQPFDDLCIHPLEAFGYYVILYGSGAAFAARGVRPGRAEDVRQEEVGGDGEEQRGERGEDGGGRRISPVRALRGGGGGRGRADEGGAERAPDVELCHCPRDEVDVGAAGARVGEGEVPGVLGGALVADRGPGAGAHIEELRVLWKV